ncbi:MAG: hypothetical protein M4579_004072 [Chaenotheca gracillima]|nr:MAG: hypothetical protein M4579_004072 [Chaenotheca gracillima]
MAAPDDHNIKNLNGQWTMNKTISDDFDPILAMQGVGWLTRKAIALATITLIVKQYEGDEPGNPTHIDIQQVVTGGISGTTELRCLDWEFREHSDSIFGAVKGRSRWTKLEDVEDDFLKNGWLEGEARGDRGLVQSYVESKDNGWIANQIWGFEEIDGKRYYVRHVVVTKGEERKQARLVYDFKQE